MDLSIIIVSYNVQEYLRNCLASIRKYTKKLSYEVIVVDNNSLDDSCEMVRSEFPQVRLIESKDNPGFAKANNQGFAQSTGEFILFLNPDTETREHTLESVLSFLQKTPDAGLATCTLLNTDNTPQQSVNYFPTITRNILSAFFLNRFFLPGIVPKKQKDPTPIDYPPGAFMMLRRSTVKGNEVLNPDFFMYSEEKDLALRLLKDQWKTYIVPKAQTVHHGGKSTAEMPLNMFLELQKSQIIFFKTHHSFLHSVGLTLSWWLVLFTGLLASIPLSFSQKSAGRLKLFWYSFSKYPGLIRDILLQPDKQEATDAVSK